MRGFDDVIRRMADTVVQAASDVVANVFNSTPAVSRPVMLAALRISVESALATMTDDDRACYADALAHLNCTTTKIPKGGGGP